MVRKMKSKHIAAPSVPEQQDQKKKTKKKKPTEEPAPVKAPVEESSSSSCSSDEDDAVAAKGKAASDSESDSSSSESKDTVPKNASDSDSTTDDSDGEAKAKGKGKGKSKEPELAPGSDSESGGSSSDEDEDDREKVRSEKMPALTQPAAAADQVAGGSKKAKKGKKKAVEAEAEASTAANGGHAEGEAAAKGAAEGKSKKLASAGENDEEEESKEKKKARKEVPAAQHNELVGKIEVLMKEAKETYGYDMKVDLYKGRAIKDTLFLASWVHRPRAVRLSNEDGEAGDLTEFTGVRPTKRALKADKAPGERKKRRPTKEDGGIYDYQEKLRVAGYTQEELLAYDEGAQTHKLQYMGVIKGSDPVRYKTQKCNHCPKGTYPAYNGRSPFGCYGCKGEHFHPKCFREYHAKLAGLSKGTLPSHCKGGG